MNTLKEIVSGGKTAKFLHFKHGSLWYVTECGFEFPVPAEDITGESELHTEERAMALMKWIRKHLEFINDSKRKHMKLYEAPSHSKVRLLEDAKAPVGARSITCGEIIDFQHLDGMYSFCYDADGNIVHIAAYADVEVVDDDAWWLYKAERARKGGFILEDDAKALQEKLQLIEEK